MADDDKATQIGSTSKSHQSKKTSKRKRNSSNSQAGKKSKSDSALALPQEVSDTKSPVVEQVHSEETLVPSTRKYKKKRSFSYKGKKKKSKSQQSLSQQTETETLSVVDNTESPVDSSSISQNLKKDKKPVKESIQKSKSESEIHKQSSSLRKKRKRREIPAFSPKRLRSSSSAGQIEFKSLPVKKEKAKTGGRNSRTVNPSRNSAGATASVSSSNLGSCASSNRRHRRWRNRENPPAMENDDLSEEPIENNESDLPNAADENSSGVPHVGAVASFGSSGGVTSFSSSLGGASSSQEGDIELGLEEGDMSRLQALLEARGLPAHLFGSLGPRMHLLLHKTFNSGAGSKAQQLITSMQSSDEGTQLQGAMEMCQLLVMGNEETLAGFPIKQVVPVLMTLLQMEHNFDIMNHACRALTYLMEALPRSSSSVVDAIPALLEKLETIQCMDVAEQSLTALEMLSKRHGKDVLLAGGLGASLLFLDFFSIVAQRSALSIAANCCQSVTSEEFSFVKDSLQILTTRLNNQDKKSLEYVCSAFARLVDNLQNDKTILLAICEHGLLANIKQLLVVSPPIISSSTFVMVVRMLAIMCSSNPTIAVKLVKLNIAETIRYLLIGSNDVPADETVELIPRSPQEFYEITCLISELLPKLPTTGIFSVDLLLSKNTENNGQGGTWQWKDDRGAWHSYLWVDCRIIEAAYSSGEDEISLTTQGRNYIIDFANMQQVNEDTGTIRSIQRKLGSGSNVTLTSKSKTKTGLEEDDRAVIFDKELELGKNLVHSLIAVIYDVYFSSVGAAVKHKCLNSILKMIYYGPHELLKDVLIKIPVSSYIAGMMSSSDLKIISSALQKADLLMSKLSCTFHVFFRREGVMHKIKALADGNINGSPPANSRTKSVILSTNNTKVKKNLSNNDLSKVFDDLSSVSEGNIDTSDKTSSNSRIASLRSKKRSVKILTRRSAKSNEDTLSNTTKKLSHEPSRPKSANLSAVSSYTSASSSSSKSSFFSNFAPRWGRSQSYQNTVPSSNSSNENPIKERQAKEQEKNKEKIRAWIQSTADDLYKKYFADESGSTHPALSILKNLSVASEELSVHHDTDMSALNQLRDVLLNIDASADASPFEIDHSGMVTSLLKYLTFEEKNKNDSPKHLRIQRFLQVFLGLQSRSNVSLKEVSSSRSGLQALVLKLNLCINQLEQFPVKCHDIPNSCIGSSGSRGSSALRFFNTHQIKCNLQRHPDCSVVKQWSGGTVKIDPLALVQAIERYLVVRGFAKIQDGNVNDASDDDDQSENDGEDLLVSLLQHSHTTKHVLEFTLNGVVLPYNMTVYQAVKQYSRNAYIEEADDDNGPFGPTTIWSDTHTLYYRPISTVGSATTTEKGLSRRSKSDSSCSKASSSKSSLISEQIKQNDSDTFLSGKLPDGCCIADPSVNVICLLRSLYYLNSNWKKYLNGEVTVSTVQPLDFVNTKLTAKAMRQLQDPLVIMTGNLPSWLGDLAKACPFIFPFECRQLLFYTTTFDRDRAMVKLLETLPELASSDSSDRVAPRLDKKKRTVSRTDIFKQAETIINDCINNKSLLEIHYQGEVGTGLGPTLEFYTLVSKEFQKSDHEMWRGETVIDGSGEKENKVKYIFNKEGLFPAPVPRYMKTAQLTKLKAKFKFLGKFMAKACMDCRMIDIPFSRTFYKVLLNDDKQSFDLSDIMYVDETLYKSLSQLNDIVKQKKNIMEDKTHSPDSLKLALSSLTLDGTYIEDLGLDFVLPGTNIELKKNGKDTPVTIENLDEYLKLTVEYTLVDGISKQVQALKEGFSQFFPHASLRMFYPSEMDVLMCGSQSQQWQMKDLIECCRPDHGYNADSRAVKFLFEILSKYNSEEQRMFLQFITGSPKLPVGGFKSLNPALTIVRKTVDGELNPDDYLPSVMTCVNYLKLPDYSSVKIMSEKLRTAYNEGKNAFHLS